ncbi:Acyl-CoA N-acyltransferase [Gracilaria domingensis]|nr:Acyl-CoA N-acyltransferase [Gracilaria domingensis]
MVAFAPSRLVVDFRRGGIRRTTHIATRRNIPKKADIPLRCELRPHPVDDGAVQPVTHSTQYRLSVVHSVAEIAQKEWDELASYACGSPFLLHDWLRCLEQSKCVSVHTGWKPSHVVLRNGRSDDIVAIAPAYIKTHSMGEFVFDYEWAEAAHSAGILYYPKLLLAVPFTPASGRRILTKESSTEARENILSAFAKALVELCAVLRVSSVHVNFCLKDEVRALASAGFLQRKGVQYHFTNYKKGQSGIAFDTRPSECSDGQLFSEAGQRVPYIDFEDYLSEFKSKRRIKMRRERTVVREESCLKIDVVRGENIGQELMEQMFRIYKSTIDKQFYGRQYLTKSFFQMLARCEEFKKHICLVVARSTDDDRLIGGTFNIIGDKEGGAFYGRYWGCVEEVRYLHFEACYYAAIEYCIENGLSRMEPGAGGGDFKYMRGFEPSITMSMHYLQDKRLANAVARYLDLESLHIDGAVSQLKMDSAIRSKALKNGGNL